MVKDLGHLEKSEEEVGGSYTSWWIETASFIAAVCQNGTPGMEVVFLICSEILRVK